MSVDIELRKAAALINAGRLDAARTILSEYLKDFPESDLAWLLMSYVLEEPRKQQAAATRALRLNPDNEQAKARIDQLMQFQSPPTPEITSENFASDFQRYYPGQDTHFEVEEQISPSLSVEERLAFVTLEAESSRDSYSRDYPARSLLSNGAQKRSDTQGLEAGRKLSVKNVAGALILIVLLSGITYLGFKFFTGGFISAADAEATASMGTAIAKATNDVKGLLPPTWTPTTTPTLSPSSTPRPTDIPTSTPTMIPPDPTIGAEIDALQKQLADLRQLSILTEVDTQIVHRIKVRSILENYYFSLEGSEQEIENNRRVWVVLGLIEPSYDLLTNVLNSLVDGVGGFYLHENNQIYVIGTGFSAIEKFIYSHEYGHALVDQNYNLNGMGVYPRCEGNEDRCKAIQAIIEGDATLLMLQWLDQGTTASEYSEIVKYNPPNPVLSENSPPPFALRNSEFTYTIGQAFVEELYEGGGWSAINQTYSRLPESTEQILHSAKYAAGEKPIVVSEITLDTVLGVDWGQIQSNTLGEWLTYLILGYGADPKAQLNEGDAFRASAGWGGDHYQVYYNEKSNETVLVAHWKWDQPSDSQEFATGMRYYLQKRFSHGEVVELNRECWHEDDQFTCFYYSGQQSLWIVAPSMDLVDAIQELYPDF